MRNPKTHHTGFKKVKLWYKTLDDIKYIMYSARKRHSQDDDSSLLKSLGLFLVN